MNITIKEYEEISIRGFEATQKVGGTIRGGIVLSGFFYYPASTTVGIIKTTAKDWMASIQDDAETIAAYQSSFNKEG